jgi:hypothetical protein
MVDRIGVRAMNAYKATLPKTSDDAPFIYSHRKGLARAAIAAMREPTEPMQLAGHNLRNDPMSVMISGTY